MKTARRNILGLRVVPQHLGFYAVLTGRGAQAKQLALIEGKEHAERVAERINDALWDILEEEGAL